MAPRTRARTAAAASASASSSSSPSYATKLMLHGGVPHHPVLAGLWRDERLTPDSAGPCAQVTSLTSARYNFVAVAL